MITGSDIRKARQRAGMSQAELAKALGVTLRTVGGWERGETSPGGSEQRLIDLLGLHDGEPSAGDLSAVDDLVLLAEIARRLARSNKEVGTGHVASPEQKMRDVDVEHDAVPLEAPEGNED